MTARRLPRHHRHLRVGPDLRPELPNPELDILQAVLVLPQFTSYGGVGGRWGV